MKTFKLNFLEFVRTKFCIIIYIVVNASMFLTSLYRMFFNTMSTRLFVPNNLSQIQALGFSEYNLRFAAIVFIMFLFTSHYYFSQARKNEFLECASVTTKGKNGFIMNQFSVMLTLALITCAVTFLMSIIFSFKDPNADGAYFLYCAKISILYFFLANIIAILIGLLCSTIKKTAAAYLVLIISSFVFSPMASRLTGEIYNRSDESIYPLWRIFEIFQNTSYDTTASGVNANIKSLSIIVFWISLFAIIAMFTVFSFRIKRAKQIVATICLIVFVLSGAGTLMPYSAIPSDYNSVGSDTDHYVFQDPERFVIQKNEEPNFEITGYDMNFKIKNLLSGDVTVKVDNPNLTEYHFTLYYGYKLKSVTNSSGEKLKYDRDGDYITVHTDAPTESFNFKYKGFSQVFYSNSQSCELLGGFAYYPINGFRYVYSVADQGSIRTKLSKSVPMSVKVDCGKTMFSNLESTGKNTFEGTSDSLTLVSGFYKEINTNGIRMIYPYYESPYDIDGVKDYETQLKMLIDKKPKYKGKTVILASGLGGSADDRIFTASDQVLATNISTIYDDTQEEFFKEKGDPKIKNDYYFAFLKYYDKDSELYKLTQQDPSTLPDDSDDLNTVLAKKIIQYKGDESFDAKFRNAMNTSEYESALDLARNVGEDNIDDFTTPY
ncbi:hypothetical protein [uncultured Eubacterium sp.]|mgnify:CR=1 FL=1|uniref:hypothetical protein n=1 Tax=uncultured Eubacterium sp. TaxID=165185 RepID=UPI002615AA0C|nr:hypothetical protein [uncultured Eubacterium sp.]